MPDWGLSVAGTAALSMASAYFFLRVRCRGAGYPFGPRGRWWAIAVIVATAAVSAAVGLAAAAASHRTPVAYVGLVVPGALWLESTGAESSRRGGLAPGWLRGWLTFPLQRLIDAIGEDLESWCAIRQGAVAGVPRLVADAAQYYHNQMAGRLKGHRAKAEIDVLLESIRHKARIARLVDLDTTPDRLRAQLRAHPSTRHAARFATADPQHLAERLLSDAESELRAMLSQAYRQGYHRMLIYPSRVPPRDSMRWPGPLRQRTAGL